MAIPLSERIEIDPTRGATPPVSGNSAGPNFDWHAQGVYIAVNPHGHVMFGTASDYGWGARAELLRIINNPWSKASAEGYVIQGFEKVVG